MPTPKKGEKRSDYVARCVPFVIKEEGLDNEAAAGKCEGMFDEHQKKGKKANAHSNIMGFIHDKQWAILPNHLSSMIDIVNGNGNVQAALEIANSREVTKASVRKIFAADDFNPSNGMGTELPGNDTASRKATAVIDVMGPIFPRANILQSISGATTVESIKAQFQEAMDDPEVGHIVLHFDSPGGEVTGIDELAACIYDARCAETAKGADGKRIISYVSGTMASAAYWIGSAAHEIIVSSVAMVGSIGVIVSALDDSRAREKAGLKRHDIVSSVSPNKNPDVGTDQGRAQIQAIVDDVANVFVSTVARNRGITAETVEKEFGGGDMYVGQKAVSRGMADGLGTYQQTIENKPQEQGALYMPSKEEKKAGAKALKVTAEGTPPGKPATKEDEKDPEAKVEDTEDGTEVTKEKAKAKAALPDEDDKDDEEEDESDEEKKKEMDAKAEEPKKDEGYTAGASAERVRIQAIEAIRAPGFEKFIAANKFNPAMTAEKISAMIVEKQTEIREGRMSAWQADAMELAETTKKIKDVSETPVNTVDALVAMAVEGANKYRGK